jgi:hypothetical protein
MSSNNSGEGGRSGSGLPLRMAVILSIAGLAGWASQTAGGVAVAIPVAVAVATFLHLVVPDEE